LANTESITDKFTTVDAPRATPIWRERL